MNTTNLLTAGFSLLAVFSWGTSDFLGGLAARTSEVYLLTALTHASGLVAVTLAALLLHAPLPSHAAKRPPSQRPQQPQWSRYQRQRQILRSTLEDDLKDDELLDRKLKGLSCERPGFTAKSLT